ncbi:MAG TPA: branched-chain amino acid transaminase [Candidatus Eisenbacteria bacterium]|nr:branched-chain amino acid transaminase [Candidatus Eisenbacteria bacterium]
MPIPPPPASRAEYIWFDGDFVPWESAQIHVLSHVIHYGSSVFEGIRCYKTPDGPAVFRLREHVQRLLYSAKVARIELRFSEEELFQGCLDAVRRNGFEACYIRPIAFRGAGGMGVLPRDNPIHIAIATWDWGAYLGHDGIEQGVDVMVSTFRKQPPGTLPASVKFGGGYALSTLAKLEAARLGFAEAVLLDTEGRVAEGTGENIFAVLDGKLLTPPLAYSILGGITRRSVIELAADHRIKVSEEPLTRDMLYMAEEIFFSGTAAEITPVKSVDNLPVGKGKRGPITRKLQTDFFDIVNGRAPDRHGWLTRVPSGTRLPA